MLVPLGWRSQGEVFWLPDHFCTRPFQPRMQATSPDGMSRIELVPGEGWGANNRGQPLSNRCGHAGHSSAQAYLQAWVARHRPGATWLEYRVRPERSNAGRQTPYAGGGGARDWIETGQALIGYVHQGKPVRETLAVSIAFGATVVPMVGGGSYQTITGESYGVLSWRAPEGQLDARHFDAMWDTLRPTTQWQPRLQAALDRMRAETEATQREIGRINDATRAETLAHMQRRAQIRAQTQREVSEIYSGIARERAAANDRMHGETVRTLREVQLYREGSGGRVELPAHYHHAWRLRDGSYVLTDSPNFDPARDLGVAGEQLQRTR
jgi:hypothetical protein